MLTPTQIVRSPPQSMTRRCEKSKEKEREQSSEKTKVLPTEEGEYPMSFGVFAPSGRKGSMRPYWAGSGMTQVSPYWPCRKLDRRSRKYSIPLSSFARITLAILIGFIDQLAPNHPSPYANDVDPPRSFNPRLRGRSTVSVHAILLMAISKSRHPDQPIS